MRMCVTTARYVWNAVSNWTGAVTVCSLANASVPGVLPYRAKLHNNNATAGAAGARGDGPWAPLATLTFHTADLARASGSDNATLLFYLGDADCSIPQRATDSSAAARADDDDNDDDDAAAQPRAGAHPKTTAWRPATAPGLVAALSFRVGYGRFYHAALYGNYSERCDSSAAKVLAEADDDSALSDWVGGCAFNVSAVAEVRWVVGRGDSVAAARQDSGPSFTRRRGVVRVGRRRGAVGGR